MAFQSIEFAIGPFIGGLAFASICSFLVGPFLQWATESLMKDGEEIRWVDFSGPGGTIGRIESLSFYVSIIIGFPQFIGAWLIFKVAAKWETWAHVVQMKQLSDLDMNSREFEDRYRFASWLLSRFLLGTLSNIVIAVASASIYLVLQN